MLCLLLIVSSATSSGCSHMQRVNSSGSPTSDVGDDRRASDELRASARRSFWASVGFAVATGGLTAAYISSVDGGDDNEIFLIGAASTGVASWVAHLRGDLLTISAEERAHEELRAKIAALDSSTVAP